MTTDSLRSPSPFLSPSLSDYSGASCGGSFRPSGRFTTQLLGLRSGTATDGVSRPNLRDRRPASSRAFEGAGSSSVTQGGPGLSALCDGASVIRTRLRLGEILALPRLGFQLDFPLLLLPRGGSPAGIVRFRNVACGRSCRCVSQSGFVSRICGVQVCFCRARPAVCTTLTLLDRACTETGALTGWLRALRWLQRKETAVFWPRGSSGAQL